MNNTKSHSIQCENEAQKQDRTVSSYSNFRPLSSISCKSISPVIAMITPGIVNQLMENRGLSLKEASGLLYNSQLYEALEDEKTKVWRLGYPLLYDLLEEELTTGKITFPEEQI